MTGFEPWIFGVTTNCATTTTHCDNLLLLFKIAKYDVVCKQTFLTK